MQPLTDEVACEHVRQDPVAHHTRKENEAQAKTKRHARIPRLAACKKPATSCNVTRLRGRVLGYHPTMPVVAVQVAPPPMSPLILACLFGVLGASVTMYWLLVRRWTSRRQWVSLGEWARQAGFGIGREMRESETSIGGPILPPPLDVLGTERLSLRMQLTGQRSTILQAQRAEADGSSQPSASSPLNLLVRKFEATWPPSALRPVHTPAGASVIDLYSLGSFPLMGAGHRFTVYGADSAAARALAQSSIRALLPQDVGLLLHGRHLVLDFSSRPFDGLEFNRMIALAEQLLAHLPAWKAG
jgi:hypothetical protein